MTEIKRDWDILSDEERKGAIDEIIGYFTAERNEEIGIIAAGELLDMFLRTTGGAIYNHALDDIRPLLEKNLSTTLLDIDTALRKNNLWTLLLSQLVKRLLISMQWLAL